MDEILNKQFKKHCMELALVTMELYMCKNCFRYYGCTELETKECYISLVNHLVQFGAGAEWIQISHYPFLNTESEAINAKEAR